MDLLGGLVLILPSRRVVAVGGRGRGGGSTSGTGERVKHLKYAKFSTSTGGIGRLLCKRLKRRGGIEGRVIIPDHQPPHVHPDVVPLA